MTTMTSTTVTATKKGFARAVSRRILTTTHQLGFCTNLARVSRHPSQTQLQEVMAPRPLLVAAAAVAAVAQQTISVRPHFMVDCACDQMVVGSHVVRRTQLLLSGTRILRSDVHLQVAFNGSTPLNVVDKLYVNYNIDTGSLFNGIDFFDPKFRALSKNLGPAVLRVGGTAVDYSFYQPDVPYIVGQVNGACLLVRLGAALASTAS